jgi:uncharacterized repeat protein (TIGR03803 family)
MKFLGTLRRVAVSTAAIALATTLSAQTVKDVARFTGNNSSGTSFATPIQGHDGKLYGCSFDPKGTAGSVFSLTTGGAMKTIYTFDFTNGSDPTGLTLATDGNFYGTATNSGSGTYGTLFRLTSAGAITVLHDFLGGSDGAGPSSPPIQGSDGNLYGTTTGAAGIFQSTIYKYSSGTFTTIFQFTDTQGKLPGSSPIQGSDGNLYGAALEGGAFNNGSIYKISTSGSLLFSYSFPAGGKFGVFPSGIMQASDGNFYGTTFYGGNVGQGNGTVFKMDQNGVVSVLYNFPGNTGGANPSGGVVEATDGNLYGTTSAGGTFGFGTIFRISTTGKFKTLYSFSAAVGENPSSAPIQRTSGLFYGSLPFGSKYGYGAIYSLDMGFGPFVAFVLPSGKVGQTVQILGQGFTGTTSVAFQGGPAVRFSVKSDTT